MVKEGQPVALYLESQGQVDSASIEGSQVSVPIGVMEIVTKGPGCYVASAEVSGPGGLGHCHVRYAVK